MVRGPCCEKIGLKRGPWSPEEDLILISYIQSYGHGNWRALPKQAGLLRCGKSCRLRWINYLRPDLKRGNFSKEEEDSIINLHQILGNRWSAIAARLPGRTDNEIKNVWHTHLKKRAKINQTVITEVLESKPMPLPSMQQNTNPISADDPNPKPVSPVESYSDVSAASGTVETMESHNGRPMKEEDHYRMDSAQDIDDSFWWEALSLDAMVGDHTTTDPISPTIIDHDTSFWLRVFNEAGDQHELLT